MIMLSDKEKTLIQKGEMVMNNFFGAFQNLVVWAFVIGFSMAMMIAIFMYLVIFGF